MLPFWWYGVPSVYVPCFIGHCQSLPPVTGWAAGMTYAAGTRADWVLSPPPGRSGVDQERGEEALMFSAVLGWASLSTGSGMSECCPRVGKDGFLSIVSFRCAYQRWMRSLSPVSTPR